MTTETWRILLILQAIFSNLICYVIERSPGLELEGLLLLCPELLVFVIVRTIVADEFLVALKRSGLVKQKLAWGLIGILNFRVDFAKA